MVNKSNFRGAHQFRRFLFFCDFFKQQDDKRKQTDIGVKAEALGIIFGIMLLISVLIFAILKLREVK